MQDSSPLPTAFSHLQLELAHCFPRPFLTLFCSNLTVYPPICLSISVSSVYQMLCTVNGKSTDFSFNICCLGEELNLYNYLTLHLLQTEISEYMDNLKRPLENITVINVK